MNKRERTERARQEDAVLNKVLYWIVGAVVLEFLLLLVNRFYIKYTVATIGTANAIEAVLTVLSMVFPLCFVAALVWWILSHRKGSSATLPGFLTILAAALAVCCIITRVFKGSGVQLLYVAVPVVAVLALIFYLYQKEFFTVATLSALGILGVWMSQRAAGHPILVYGYMVVLAVILVAVAVMSRILQGKHGVLALAGKPRRILPKNANYIMFYVTCAIIALVVIASIFLGAHAALYGVLVAWLLVSAVYYTVKLM